MRAAADLEAPDHDINEPCAVNPTHCVDEERFPAPIRTAEQMCTSSLNRVRRVRGEYTISDRELLNLDLQHLCVTGVTGRQPDGTPQPTPLKGC